jgi:hypothetical protein
MESNTRSYHGMGLLAAAAPAGYDAGADAIGGTGGVLDAGAAGAGSSAAEVCEQDLAALFDHLKAAERSIAAAVRLAGRLASSGVAERVEGGALDWAISMACRWTGSDARTIVGAGEMLAHLPTTDRLFTQGLISWGQVRRITAAARRLTVQQRATLDGQVAAAVDRYDGIDAFDPDHLCDAVDLAVEDLRGARERERQERAAARENLLSVQLRTDGGSTGYWSGDAVGTAPILNAIAAARPVPVATPDGEREPDAPTRQGAQQFAALHDICAEYLAGTNSDLVPASGNADAGSETDAPVDGVPDGSSATRHPLLPRRLRRRRAEPLLTLHVDVSQAHVDPTGIIQLNVPGALPRISAALLEILARDADFQAVLFDGKRPLAVSRKLRAKDIPADVRTAVAARDMGDRWPGSRAPIGWTEPHHITMRSRGGLHHVDDLISLTRAHHTTTHNRGWTITLNKHTGEARFRRRGRTWRSLPRDTRLPPPDTPPPPDPDPTPPGLPF